MLGSKVDIDHSRQRQIHGGEKRTLLEDRDWSCFKVQNIVHSYQKIAKFIFVACIALE